MSQFIHVNHNTITTGSKKAARRMLSPTKTINIRLPSFLVQGERIELPTSGLSVLCSSQLSYPWMVHPLGLEPRPSTYLVRTDYKSVRLHYNIGGSTTSGSVVPMPATHSLTLHLDSSMTRRLVGASSQSC